MSITVTTAVATALPATNDAGIPVDPAAIGGFADLLSLQISDLIAFRPAETSIKEENTPTDDTNAGTAATPTDPALLLANMPAVPLSPPVENTAEQSLHLDPAILAKKDRREQPVTLPQATTSGASTPQETKLAVSLNTGGQEAKPLLDHPDMGKAATIAAQPTASSETNTSAFASTLGAQLTGTVAARHPTTTSAPMVNTPLNDAQWTQDFSNQVVWLAKNDQQTAQININPPQLGPIQISLSLNGDQASAVFTSPHAEVRQAIEDAMPRLREMMAGAGIDLGQTNVGAQLAKQQDGNPSQRPDSPRFASDNAILRGDSSSSGNMPVSRTQSGRGLVDLFA